MISLHCQDSVVPALKKAAFHILPLQIPKWKSHRGQNQVKNIAQAQLIHRHKSRKGKNRSLDFRDLLKTERNESPVSVTWGMLERCWSNLVHRWDGNNFQCWDFFFVKLSQYFYNKYWLHLWRIKALADKHMVEVQRMMIYIPGGDLTESRIRGCANTMVPLLRWWPTGKRIWFFHSDSLTNHQLFIRSWIKQLRPKHCKQS